MNAFQSFAAALALTAAAAGPALAQEATLITETTAGAVSRASVAAEARLAVQQGHTHELYAINPVQSATSLLSRESVRAETRAALASGEIARLNARTYETAAHAAKTATNAAAVRMSMVQR